MHLRIAALESEVLGKIGAIGRYPATVLRDLIELEPGVVVNLVLSNLKGPHLDLSRSDLC